MAHEAVEEKPRRLKFSHNQERVLPQNKEFNGEGATEKCTTPVRRLNLVPGMFARDRGPEIPTWAKILWSEMTDFTGWRSKPSIFRFLHNDGEATRLSRTCAPLIASRVGMAEKEGRDPHAVTVLEASSAKSSPMFPL